MALDCHCQRVFNNNPTMFSRSTCKLFVNRLIYITIIISQVYIWMVDGRATTTTKSPNRKFGRNDAGALAYLSRFGYLPSSDLETGELRTDTEYRRAIRSFQKYAGLRETGKLDQATRDQMSKPRCGLGDVITTKTRRKRFNLATDKWKKNHLTYRFLNYSPDIDIEKTRDAITRALYQWSQVTPLTFSENRYGDADIMIKFATYYHSDGYPFDGQGQVLAHAFFPGDGTRAGDVHFDDDEVFTVYEQDGIDLFTVATHEFGHSLGLAHSSDQRAVMFPWYQGYYQGFKLNIDDIWGIQTLYGSRYRAPERPQPQTPTPTSSTSTTLRSTSSQGPRSTQGPPPEGSTTPPPLPPSTLSPRPTLPPDGSQPDPCDTSYDAIAIIRHEMFIFRGQWFWRRKREGDGSLEPLKIHQFWYGYPKDITSVDAVYERPGDNKIVFFKGNKYWLFNNNQLVVGYEKTGRPITELGLPHDVKKIDAAFVWGHNGKTYFISGDMYWRYNEEAGQVGYEYPRDMSMWKGVPLPVDSAMQDWEGRTYFFKDTEYYQFNDARMEIRKEYPKPFAPVWMGCKPVKLKALPSGHGAAPKQSTTPVLIYTTLLMSVLTFITSC